MCNSFRYGDLAMGFLALTQPLAINDLLGINNTHRNLPDVI